MHLHHPSSNLHSTWGQALTIRFYILEGSFWTALAGLNAPGRPWGREKQTHLESTLADAAKTVLYITRLQVRADRPDSSPSLSARRPFYHARTRDRKSLKALAASTCVLSRCFYTA